jgi:hypothetical protein
MPLVNHAPAEAGSERLRFIYLCDPTRIINDLGKTVAETTPAIAADQFRGGSQAIEFEGGWLTLIHEAEERPSTNQRYYRHRFVWFDGAKRLCRVSRSFYFQKKGVEFAAGLAWHPDGKRLLVSYSVADSEAWIATVDAGEVRALLDDVHYLPSGALSTSPVKAEADPQSGHEKSGTRDRHAMPSAPALPVPEERIGVPKTSEEIFYDLAPFLRIVDSPRERSEQSRAFDTRIAPFLGHADGTALPQIHCFYEALSETAEHRTLIAAVTSMRAAGHPVKVWSYSPQKLEFLRQHGVELRPAADVVPRQLYDRIVKGSEIRYFSDIFRYAVLYEHGGLWMDSDVILLRPFPFRGDHFFNLQWRGGHKGHYVCGNVMYAEPYSPHMRALYEQSIERFHAASGWEFGMVGPKLLSDYIASEAGAELRDRVFGPMFFNAIDWNELDRFDKPIAELADYLNDERVFGLHLWTARNAALPQGEGAPLISLLSDPLKSFPDFTSLADRFNTDKNRHTGNRHCYARIYDRLLSSKRLSMRRLMEIGLCRGLAEGNQTETPSVALWQSYFPFCQVVGVDLTDFSKLNNERFTSFACDQSKADDLHAVAAKIEPGSLDVIIDDGSHASFDEQLTLREFFPLLAEGGWFFIEDLDWQPPGEDSTKIALTKTLLQEIKQHGRAKSIDPFGISALAGEFADILFFDSHYELARARLMGGLVAIRKRGGSRLLR